ncbi:MULTISPECIES: DUF2971 domain-containing protein [unclassified Pseudoalteromonas]|uniref:DUF2971 domain-containing protein n=1 Tax=unclassified Pseudoalteromonas TaxID=194690 RepID=UPI00140DAD1B|nr:MULTISPECIES: DUF2971 domain-containing protein [unclassified Pseudoalteromonas]MBH0040929.1 hypothetical protein [Pseudoalteromonas sp. SWXJZ10B]
MQKLQTFYKYKSLDNFEFLLDLIIKERIYAASHHELNDPMEGVVKVDGTIPKEKEQEWEELIKKFRIVCFSRDKDSPLMWSHYADGARGCVVEFQLLENQIFHKVSYLKKPSITEKHISMDKAAEILLYKEKPWKYEAESRCLIVGEKKFLLITIKSVRFGGRAEKSKVDMLVHILKLCKPNLEVLIESKQNLSNNIRWVSRGRRTYVKRPDRSQDYCPKCDEREDIQKDFCR